MAIQTRSLYIDLAKGQLVGSPASSAPLGSLKFVQGDTVRLSLHGLEVNPARPALTHFRPASIGWSSLTAGITLLDAPPVGGTFTLQIGDAPEDLTAALSATITKSALATALNALPGVTAAGGLTVGTTGAANIYRLQWTDPDAALEISVGANNLTPLAQVQIVEDDSISGKVNIKLRRAPVAVTTDFALPSPPAVTITEVRSGSAVRNEVQRLTIPSAALGGFAFTVATFGTQIVQVATASAAAIASALNEPFTSVAAADIRFAVTAPARGIFDIEFIGAYAKADQALLTVDMFDQVSIDTPTALLPLTSMAIEDLLDAAESVKAVFEIVAADEAGRESTLCQQECIILNDGLDASLATFVSEVATRTETVYLYPTETDPAVIGLLGQSFLPAILSDDFTVTHNFGSFEVDVVVLRKTGTSPEKWEGAAEGTEYVWEAINANQVQVFFGAEVPATGIGSIQIWVRTLNATPWLNDHTHPTGEITGVGADDGKTLTEIIDELRGSLPTDWPNIPAAKLSGLISPDQIDLAALATRFATTAEFLETLRTLISDPTLIGSIGTGLGTSAAFLATLKTLLTESTVVKTITDELSTSTTFRETIGTLLTSALQTGGVMPEGAVLMEIADVDKTLSPLISALLVTADLGNITGGVPRADATNLGKKYTVVTRARATHREDSGMVTRAFKDGDVIVSDGTRWFPARIESDYAYPREMEVELFRLHVNESMLIDATQFATAFTFSTKLLGAEVSGQCVFQLRAGSIDSASGRPANIASVTWETPIIEQPIVIGDARVFHTFGYSVAQDAESARTATATLYSLTSESTAPAAASFILQARLIRVDVEDISKPPGEFQVAMKAARASVITL